MDAFLPGQGETVSVDLDLTCQGNVTIEFPTYDGAFKAAWGPAISGSDDDLTPVAVKHTPEL